MAKGVFLKFDIRNMIQVPFKTAFIRQMGNVAFFGIVITDNLENMCLDIMVSYVRNEKLFWEHLFSSVGFPHSSGDQTKSET